MKRKTYKILLVILIIIIAINSTIIIFSLNSNNIYDVSIVGSNENGTVYKIVAGNNNSKDTVGIILGIHPRENEIHKAVNQTIYDCASPDGSHNLSKKYVIYYVKVNDNISSRADTREAGESLGEQYIVPNMAKDNPFIVVDIHEIDVNYEYSDFIYAVDSNNSVAQNYSKILSKELKIGNFNFTEGTSPQRISIPLAHQGLNVLLLETCITNSLKEKQQKANNIIYTLDNLNP